MVKIAIAGVCGKMGSRILTLAESDGSVEVVGVLELAGHPNVGKDIIFRREKIKIESVASGVFSKSDVVVDFTTPYATLDFLKESVKMGKPLVIGTTGFNGEQTEEIKSASQKIPIVFSPNMSLGVNLLFKLVKEVSGVLSDYDVEIVEFHHNQKKDSPSGTAAKLAQIIAESLGKNPIYGRNGITGPRKKDEIGVFAVRAGDIVGEHTVYFAGTGERIEMTHRAHSRDCFATGAIVAAKWVAQKEPRLYTMQDVLKIS